MVRTSTCEPNGSMQLLKDMACRLRYIIRQTESGARLAVNSFAR